MANSMFQHRHYAAIAAVLADARDPADNGGLTLPDRELAAIDRLETRLADLFASDNGNFDRDRFLKAARRAPDMHGKDKR